MANKREKILVNRAVAIIKEVGEISSWDLSNGLENMSLVQFNNHLKPVLKQNPNLRWTKEKTWQYKYELLPENKSKEPEPQTSIEMWIKNTN